MGELDVKGGLDGGEHREFMRRLLNDVRALQWMLDNGTFETGVRRIGAEQECFLVDKSFRPAPVSDKVLAAIGDDHFTTELARFNMEFNVDPVLFGGDCLSRLEEQIVTFVDRARVAAESVGARVLLCGILPTLAKSDLGIENMTPMQRYYALNDALMHLRKSAYEFRIKGTDELIVNHDSVMLEAANTSFQVHFQCGPEEFAKLYNVAQAVTAPVLAAAVNSPLLFGKRLWRETRIAVFQQSVDTRQSTPYLREVSPRVSFGTRWVDNSVAEIFQEDIARFRVILGTPYDEDPFEEIRAGRPPSLKALRLHNGTVYRWNRPCYGVTEGKPHIRIENRVLPAGPTPVDEVANAALWFGLMSGMLEFVGDPTKIFDFDTVKSNFVSAARHGLQAQITWVDGQPIPARELIVKTLLPLARDGLVTRGISPVDADKYLGVIERRVESGQTGAQWVLGSLGEMKDRGTPSERLTAVTAASYSRQITNTPVHEWSLAALSEAGGWRQHYSSVEQFMSTDLFTVNQDDLIDLVANVMDWEHIRHVPVEDEEQHLVGLVTHRTILRHLTKAQQPGEGALIPVRSIMEKNPITIGPAASTLDAIRIMRQRKVSCLPVVTAGRLVGLVTERHFMGITADLIEQMFEEEGAPVPPLADLIAD